MGGEGETHRDFHNEAFGDVGCNDSYGEDEVEQGGVTDGKTEAEEKGSDSKGKNGQSQDESFDFFLERGQFFLLAGSGSQIGDLSNERPVASVEDHSLTVSLSIEGGEEGNVFALEGVIICTFGASGQKFSLSGE